MFDKKHLFGASLVVGLGLMSSAQAQTEKDSHSILLAQSCQAACEQNYNNCVNTAQNYINQGQSGSFEWPCFDDCQYGIDSVCPDERQQCLTQC